MASIFKRKHKDNKGFAWRAVIRLKGYPTVCNSFERKQEAEDWASDTERRIKLGQFNFAHHNTHHTFKDLVERFINDGRLDHHRSARDTLRHLHYWQDRLDAYALIHITTDLLSKERSHLLNTPTNKSLPRSKATVNRYIASLSSALTFASKDLGWITINPCLNLKKLKENPGRDRILTPDEITRLLIAARASRSPYLYCIILIALTTGARQGEILNLKWIDIDFDNHLALLKQTKNGRPRSIPLVPAVLAELQHLYQARNPRKSLVFASHTAFGRIDIKKAWQGALKTADITNFRAHDMRHTFATLAARQGASNLELATAMGHRTLEMLQRYTHLDAQTTKKFSTTIADQIIKETHDSTI